MKASDRTVLMALAALGVLAAAWFLLLSPKRDEVAKLDEEITSVRGSLQEQQDLVAAARQAKDDYDTDYSDLVVLGKAVPEEEDTSSLFVELEALAEQSDAAFESIELNSGSASAAPPPPAAETTTDENAEDGSAAVPATPVATEATAALLPIGATIGAAGLPVMPYSVKLTGDFFQVSDFLAGVDALVETGKSAPVADGRLITIDGFELVTKDAEGGEVLDATLSVTTYVAPADQGLTGGATPTAPATATSTTTTAVPTASGAPTP
jgi:Tfp pilus assembly protein PilO